MVSVCNFTLFPDVVSGSFLICGYLEGKLFNKLPEIFSDDVVEFFSEELIYTFLDDVKCKWKESVDVSRLWELMVSLDPDIKFIFENVSTVAIFLDNSCLIKNDQLIFHIYHKLTHSFSYLHCRSCHPQLT